MTTSGQKPSISGVNLTPQMTGRKPLFFSPFVSSVTRIGNATWSPEFENEFERFARKVRHHPEC